MARKSVELWAFALVVVRRGPEEFLLVHERKHGGGWYLPAGRLEPGETFMDAAIRETREEAGIDVELEGILQIEHTPMPGASARMRVIFSGRPVDDAPPKSIPDDESLGAGWFSLAQIATLSLRGPEVLDLLRRVADGARVHPLALLGPEGRPLGTT